VLMKPPIFIRTPSKRERKALEAGLRSSDAFVLRRAQILLASSRGERPPRIAENLGCGSQTVRNAIHSFNQRGLEALTPGSSRPREVHAAFDEEGAESLREILHQDPRRFGQQSTLWTLAMAAEVSFQEGITERRVSGETIRTTLARLGIRWGRAKRWIESPDPEYARKKGLSRG
jgi:transposase